MINIFMYHQVADIPADQNPLGLAMSPVQFESQMSYLASHGYRCLSLKEAVQTIKSGGVTPAKSFVITFDDGYQEVRSIAAPILEKFGFTATIFLVANRMGSPSNWWVQNGDITGQLLTWEEARDLAQRGYTLGSHTANHLMLRRLDDQSAFAEIQNSKMLLQEQLGMQVDFFSYPYSETDARIQGLIESAGYTAACAGYMGPWGLFNLWRVPCLCSDTMLFFALKASGWYNRRTALRESSMGRLLRHSVHRLRRLLKNNQSRRQDILNNDLGMESKREP